MVKASIVVNARKFFVMTKTFQTVLTLKSSNLSQWFLANLNMAMANSRISLKTGPT
jgi:hypothetical protein